MKQSWEIKTLLDVSVSIEDGDWIEKKDQSTSGVRLIQTGNVGQGYYKDKGEKAKYISEDTFVRLKCTELTIGDILVSRLPDPVGRACILPALGVRCITAVDCSIIKLKQDIIHPQWFVYYSLSSEYAAKVKKECSGTTRDRISRKKLSCITIPVPPLAEQERIVEILDREFEKIDALKANAERNLQYAKDLLKQSQNTVYNNIETNPLDSMVTIINGYAFKSEDFSKTNPIKAVKITNVGVGIFIETIDTNLPQNLLLDKQDYTVHTGDIVFALTRTIIAAGLKVAIVPETYNCALLNQRVAALRIDDDIQRKYLYNYFQTATVKEYVLKKVNTLMQPNLSIKDLKAMPIPYCDRAEMEQIVARLDKLKENCQALEENYKKTIALCDDMKQALLRQAFNGEL